MGNILDTEPVAVLDEPKPRKRSECRCCGCERKGSGQWLDHEYCSGKCKRLDEAGGPIAEPEKIMPKTRTGKCKFCGTKPKLGTKWFDEDYCSGKCSKLDGESVATTELKNCKCCGVERNPNIIWHSRDYCSGKCKKADGGIIEPADESVDEIGADAVIKKEEQIRAVESQLATYQAEYNKANERADSALESRSDTLAQGGDDPYDTYQKAVNKRDALGNTITCIEEQTLPRLYKELQALQRSGKNIAVKKLMQRRGEVIKEMQTHMHEIDVLLTAFNSDCRAMKYGFPKTKMSPIRELCFSEPLRLSLRLRTRVRVAKKVVHDL